MKPWEKYADTAAPAEGADSAPWQKYGGQAPAAPAQPPQSMAGFVGGNLVKGTAELLGSAAGINPLILGVAGAKEIANRVLGTHLPKSESLGEELTKGATKAGLIGPSAEPRTTGQRYGASVLQSLPSAAIPGGGASALGRVAGAVGGGLGPEAGGQFGGTPGRIIGGLLGG